MAGPFFPHSGLRVRACFHPSIRIEACRGKRTFCVNAATHVLHAVADRPRVNIQSDGIHTLQGRASLASLNQCSLNSARVHQVFLHRNYTFKLIRALVDDLRTAELEAEHLRALFMNGGSEG